MLGSMHRSQSQLSSKQFQDKIKSKLAEKEKKLHEDKQYKEDKNRAFIIEGSNKFLKDITNEPITNAVSKSSSSSIPSDSQIAKTSKVFIIDKGPVKGQT